MKTIGNTRKHVETGAVIPTLKTIETLLANRKRRLVADCETITIRCTNDGKVWTSESGSQYGDADMVEFEEEIHNRSNIRELAVSVQHMIHIQWDFECGAITV